MSNRIRIPIASAQKRLRLASTRQVFATVGLPILPLKRLHGAKTAHGACARRALVHAQGTAESRRFWEEYRFVSQERNVCALLGRPPYATVNPWALLGSALPQKRSAGEAEVRDDA